MKAMSGRFGIRRMSKSPGNLEMSTIIVVINAAYRSKTIRIICSLVSFGRLVTNRILFGCMFVPFLSLPEALPADFFAAEACAVFFFFGNGMFLRSLNRLNVSVKTGRGDRELDIPLDIGSFGPCNHIRILARVLNAHWLVIERKALHRTKSRCRRTDLLEDDVGLSTHTQCLECHDIDDLTELRENSVECLLQL